MLSLNVTCLKFASVRRQTHRKMDRIYRVVWVFWMVLGLTQARIGFVKDQSTTRIEFPPKIKKADSLVPQGHLRPIGYHRSPEAPVAEEKVMLSPLEFHQKYVNISKPVVFRDSIADVPAMKTWKKDEYLKKTYGQIEVHVVVKKELKKKGPIKMTIKAFLKEYNFEDWYLSNIIPHEMMEELVLPKCLKCGMSAFLEESEIWLSSGGTASLIHSHADHNLHCLLSGRKDFVIIHPKYKEKLAFIDLPPHHGHGHSELDVDRLNLFKYPQVADVSWTWATLKPGDCIFVPAGYIHQVRSHGRSFSSTMMWAPSPETDFTDCPDEKTLNEPMPLNQAPFIWTYLKADRELANLRLNSASLRHHLLVWMRDENFLRYSVFKDYYDEIMSELSEDEKPKIEHMWMLLTEKKPGSMVIPRDEVKRIPDRNLQEVANYLNTPHRLHGHAKDIVKDEL